MSTETDSVRLVRNATLTITLGDTTFLVDPMFAEAESGPSIGNKPGVPEYLETENDRRNPMVSLPDVDLSHDAVVVTHRHDDHFDEAAVAELDSDVPLFCQPADEEAFVEEGFTDVRPVDDKAVFGDITLTRTPGQHGHGELAEMMGPVSGFVFEGETTLYVAGDTIWYEPIAETLNQFAPEAIILNGGAAQFEGHEPITMGIEDITAVRDATDAMIAVVHMEAINHCLLSRDDLQSERADVLVPADGEALSV